MSKEKSERKTVGNGSKAPAVAPCPKISDHAHGLGSERTLEPVLPHDIYREERKARSEAELTVAGTLDKQVTTIAATVLTISIAFVKEIAPQPVGKWWLAGAWGLGILSLCASLLSTMFGQYSYQRAVENLDREQREKRPFEDNPWCQRAKRFTTMSVVFLTVGVTCLAVFAFVNLPEEDTGMRATIKKVSQDGTKGSSAPPRPVPPPASQPAPPSQPQPPAAPKTSNR